VRELKNLIERLVILSTGDTIEADQLPVPFAAATDGGPMPEEVSTQPRTLEAIERAYILKILRQVNGNKSEAAKILGITRQTLRKKLTEATP
jgi:DNA-binding NtrC family response regulator